MLLNNVIGQSIGGYRVVELLATSLFCDVYRAQSLIEPEHVVAMKVLHSTSVQQRASFLQETRLLELLKHPSILPLLATGTIEDTPYMITEYLPNGSLREHIDRQSHNLLPLHESVSILIQIGQALTYAHQHNVVHGDLKPDNILFNAQGAAFLADFGLATVSDETYNEEQSATGGTVGYIAPERLDGHISPANVQYSLGCIAYEMCTGSSLFSAINLADIHMKHCYEEPEPPTQLNPYVPQELEQAILITLAKQPEKRFEDMAGFVGALQAISLPQDETQFSFQKTAVQWVSEGRTLSHFKLYENALAAYEQARVLEPDDAFIYECKALAFVELERYDEALAQYEQALERDPEDADVYEGKGNVLVALLRNEEALIAYEQAIMLTPEDEEA